MSATQYWDEAPRVSENPLHWLNVPAVRRAVLESVTGHPELDFFSYLAARYLRQPARRALVLGCGKGTVEQHLAMMGACVEVDAMDFSEPSIRVAAESAEKVGLRSRIRYVVADLNRHRLPDAAYDLAVAVGTIHHVENLEHLYGELLRSLKPGAPLFADEFVGPNRFQWTDAQLAIANQFLERALPSTSRTGRLDRPNPEHVAAVDPSESVRSKDVLPLLLERFEILERHDYGGTLLNPIIGQGLLTATEGPEIDTPLRLLHVLERALIRARVLPSDFVLVAARRKA